MTNLHPKEIFESIVNLRWGASQHKLLLPILFPTLSYVLCAAAVLLAVLPSAIFSTAPFFGYVVVTISAAALLAASFIDALSLNVPQQLPNDDEDAN